MAEPPTTISGAVTKALSAIKNFPLWLRGTAALVWIGAVCWLVNIGHDALAATILSVTIGFLVVVYQIGTQASNALKQSRANEALKLKLGVYKDLIGIARDATDAAGELSSFVQHFRMSLVLVRQLQQDVKGFTIPSENPSQLMEKKSHADSSAIKLMAVTETWQIIDQRIDIFRIAINDALCDVDAALEEYFRPVWDAMPIAFPKDEWTPPNDETMRQIQLLTNVVTNSLTTLQAYIFDFLRDANASCRVDVRSTASTTATPRPVYCGRSARPIRPINDVFQKQKSRLNGAPCATLERREFFRIALTRRFYVRAH